MEGYSPIPSAVSPIPIPVPTKQQSFDAPAADSEPESRSLSPMDGPRVRGLRHSPSAPGPRVPRTRSDSLSSFSTRDELLAPENTHNRPEHTHNRPEHTHNRPDHSRSQSDHSRSQSEHGRSRSEHSRSYSDTSSPHRHLRRRPLLLDDSSSLSRLSTLIESHNTAELDVFAHSPLESVDAFSRLALKSPLPQEATTRMRPLMLRTNGVSSDRMSPALSPIPSPRLASSWFMRPSYDEDDMKLDYDGTVKAATMPAIVERLTLDYLSTLNRYFVTLYVDDFQQSLPRKPNSDMPF